MKFFIFIITLHIKNVISQNNDPGGYSYNIENNISPALALGKILNSNAQQQQQHQQQTNIIQTYIPPSPAPPPLPITEGYIQPSSSHQQQQQNGLNFGLSNITPPQLPSNQYIPSLSNPNNQGLLQNGIQHQHQSNQNYNGNKNIIISPLQPSNQQQIHFNSILPSLQNGLSLQQQQQQLPQQIALQNQQQHQIYQNNVISPQYQTNQNTPINLQSIGGNNGVIAPPSLPLQGHQHQQENEKQIYVHLPPPSPPQEYQGYPQQLPQLPPRKHYKIILVKSPNPPTPPPVIVPQPVEEKTLVYVLVKKPDPPSQEELQAIQQQQIIKSSKPEVYFIKYKTNKEKGDGTGSNVKVQPSNETGDNKNNGNIGESSDVTAPDIDIRSGGGSDNGKARAFPNGITIPQNLIDSTASKPKSPAIYETPLKTYKS